jgi:protein O-GlcNAc transferase
MQTASEQIEAAERFLNAGELENAEVVFRELIKRTPEECEVHYKLGMVLFRRGDLAAAEAAYRDALRLHPYHPEVANALGLLLSQSKSPDGVAIKQEAESMFRIALGERPDYCDAHVNFANLLSDASRLTEARYHYLRALDSQPENALVLHNLGSGYRKSDRPLEAIAVLEKSLALNPGRADSWNELGVAYLSLSKVEEAIRYFRRADQEQPNRLPALKNIALVLNYIGADKAQVFQDHLRLGEAMRNAVAVDKAATRQLYPIPDPAKRLRIGFVTGDFREHVVSYFMLSFLRALNHRDFEYHVFHTSGQEDARSEQFRTVLHRWHRVHGMPAAELAETIAAQRIDILIDLSGHTTHSRTEVFALRPAPVQMAWIGYPNTSGLTEIDYRISDIWADPPGVDDEFHTETLLRMQRCFLCYSPPANAPEVVAAPCNRNGYITFGSFNRRTKISEECIALWAKVLRATPDSRLRL